MQKNLVIVESPAKAKTIEKFLGNDYKVLSSYGHIRDLKKKEFSIDVENGFEPTYEIPADKKKLVAKLKSCRSYSRVMYPMRIVKEKLFHGTCLKSWGWTLRRPSALYSTR